MSVSTVPAPMTWPSHYKPLQQDMQREIYDAMRFLLDPPMIKLVLTSNFTVTHNLWTSVQWQSAQYDTEQMFDTSSPTRITITVPGLYYVSFRAGYTSSFATGYVRYGIDKNGGDEAQVVESADAYNRNVINKWMRLEIGDYVEAQVFQDSGTTRYLNYDPKFTAVEAVWRGKL